MPWTFAHPAAVLPLRRIADAGYLSFPALLAGCLTPDVVYHLGLWNFGRFTHSPFGVMIVDVPAGLLLLSCSSWLRQPIAALLPEPHRSALLRVQFLARGRRRVGVMLLSLAIGAGTHLLWDAFTHQDAFFVRIFEWLGWPVRALGHEISVFHLLQHGGTLVGVSALVISYRRHLAKDAPMAPTTTLRPIHAHALLLGMAALAIAIALPIALRAALDGDGQLNLQKLLVRQVAYSSSAFLVVLSVVALICLWLRRRLGMPRK